MSESRKWYQLFGTDAEKKAAMVAEAPEVVEPVSICEHIFQGKCVIHKKIVNNNCHNCSLGNTNG